jgi:uncharacterized protein (TIGR02271 family)
MITENDIHHITGATVYAFDGDKIGSAGQVYLDDQTGAPEWVSVRTGLFGTKESFVPLHEANLAGDRLEVPFGKDQVKNAPRIDPDGALSVAEEDELYRYYGFGSTGGRLTDTTGRRDSDGDGVYDDVEGRAVGYDTSGPTTDAAMTRSEEHLVVGTRTEQVGRARLRKYVVTEQETVTVPVSHEEVRLEREPITNANIDRAMAGPAISEAEHEVTLRAERAVVTTEAVPVERVRLGKETVTEQETVTGTVRKEHIELEDDTTTGRDRR